MFPSVGEVLALDVLRRGLPRVVAGERGLGAPVRWVHSSEVPDIAHLLRGGELVLTTGIALPSDETGLTRFVDELASVGASGLVVELGRRWTDGVPAALRAAAARRGLPLVELHREIPFVAITESVHARIVDAQVAELRAAEEVHQTFTELSVEGAGPDEVVRQVARMSGRPAVLENLAHQVLTYDAAGADPDVLLDGWDARSRAVRPETRTAYAAEAGWLVTVVGARGHDWGRLVIVVADAPVPRLVVLLERAASTLAVNRLVDRDREGLERQTHRTLLAGILTHAVAAAEIALRARAVGVPLDARWLVGVVLRLRGVAGQPALHIQARLRDLAEAVAEGSRDAGLAALVGALDEDSVGLLVSLEARDRDESALDALTTALARRRGDQPEPVVAAGSVVGGVRDARRSLLEAQQVAEAALHLRERRRWYRLPDVHLRGLVHLLRDDARLQTYVERELGALLQHDGRSTVPLEPVLRAYLEHGRNKSAAAAAAHLSRPAFYERLHKVERVLGIDLDSVETSLSLHVAVVALDALRADGTNVR